MSDHHNTLHGHRGSGATDHWLHYRDLPQLRRRGRWTSDRTLERYINADSLKQLQTESRLSQSSRLVSLQNKTSAFSTHRQPLHPPHRKRKSRGAHSVHRSGVEQRSFAHTVSPLKGLLVFLSDVGCTQKRGAYDAHKLSTDMQRSFGTSHAHGGRALELQFLLNSKHVARTYVDIRILAVQETKDIGNIAV